MQLDLWYTIWVIQICSRLIITSMEPTGGRYLDIYKPKRWDLSRVPLQLKFTIIPASSSCQGHWMLWGQFGSHGMDPFQSHLDALDEGVGHQEEHPRHAWVQGAGPRHGSHRGRAKMEQLLNMDTTLLTEYIRSRFRSWRVFLLVKIDCTIGRCRGGERKMISCVSQAGVVLHAVGATLVQMRAHGHLLSYTFAPWAGKFHFSWSVLFEGVDTQVFH